METTTKKKLLASMVGLFAAGGVATATAQDAVGESARAQGVLDEIIVTSTRRAESLNDAALSVAAISGEDITRRNILEMNDYLRTVPGVTFLGQGVGRNTVVVRGLVVDTEFPGGSGGNTVGIYLGEVPLTGLSALDGSADIRMIDLERVEVLRGPQGTLFGSGSLAGAVRNLPKAPNLQELGGYVKGSYSNTVNSGSENTKFEGVINIPLVEDILAVRALAYRHEDSGYVENIAGTQLATNGPVSPNFSPADAVDTFGGADLYKNKSDIGNTTFTGGRVSVKWQPVDEFSSTLLYVTQDVEQDGWPYVQINTGGYTQVALSYGDALPGQGEGLDDDIDIVNLELDYDLGWASLMSSSSWVEEEGGWSNEVSSFFAGIPVARPHVSSSDAFVQELRIVSQLEGPLQFILGAYYEDVELSSSNPFFALTDITLNDIFAAPLGADTYQIHSEFSDRETEQKAVYGELSYDFTEELEMTVGFRRFDYERTRHSFSEGALGDRDSTEKFSEKDTNLKANVSYQPSDNTLIYAQWAEGFRLGDNTFPVIESLCDVNDDGILDGTTTPLSDSFDSDTVENFELGTKLSLMDRRIQVNASAYQVDWKDIPLQVFGGKLPSQPEQICQQTITANAGEARTRGFELESTFQLSESVRLSLGGAYTDAELTKVDPGVPFEKGDRLPSSPDYSFNFAIDYEFYAMDKPSYIRADYSYVGKFYNKVGEEGVEAGGYGQANLSAGVTLNDVDVEFFVNNLTDDDAITLASAIWPDTRAWRLRPRTAGFNVSYNF
ncbi:TonB-dependent receptor [SAR92 clade bacterium H246]